MTASHTCPVYEVVSVAAKNAVLVTVSIEELAGLVPQQVDQALLRDDTLFLDVTTADGQSHELVFPNVPEMDRARLREYQATFCGLTREGVQFALPLPPVRKPVLAAGKPR